EPRAVMPPEMLPYKPMLMSKTAIATLDFDEGYKASARLVFTNKEATDEGEHALKTGLYVIRELLAMMPDMERGMRPLAPLAEPVEKAFKSAKIVRKGNALETSVRLTVAPGVADKISKDFAAERKREEEERDRRFRDKKKFVDK